MKSPTRSFFAIYLAMWFAILCAVGSFAALLLMAVRYNDFGMIGLLLVFGGAMGAIVYSGLVVEIGD